MEDHLNSQLEEQYIYQMEVELQDILDPHLNLKLQMDLMLTQESMLNQN